MDEVWLRRKISVNFARGRPARSTPRPGESAPRPRQARKILGLARGPPRAQGM